MHVKVGLFFTWRLAALPLAFFQHNVFRGSCRFLLRNRDIFQKIVDVCLAKVQHDLRGNSHAPTMLLTDPCRKGHEYVCIFNVLCGD